MHIPLSTSSTSAPRVAALARSTPSLVPRLHHRTRTIDFRPTTRPLRKSATSSDTLSTRPHHCAFSKSPTRHTRIKVLFCSSLTSRSPRGMGVPPMNHLRREAPKAPRSLLPSLAEARTPPLPSPSHRENPAGFRPSQSFNPASSARTGVRYFWGIAEREAELANQPHHFTAPSPRILN